MTEATRCQPLPHKSRADNRVVAGFLSEKCGWIDYAYWDVLDERGDDDNDDGGRCTIRFRVFSRSSSFLCHQCPTALRCCFGMFCQCYGDSGLNRQHIAELVELLKAKGIDVRSVGYLFSLK
jgi:hypothetical protein